MAAHILTVIQEMTSKPQTDYNLEQFHAGLEYAPFGSQLNSIHWNLLHTACDNKDSSGFHLILVTIAPMYEAIFRALDYPRDYEEWQERLNTAPEKYVSVARLLS